MWEFEAKNRNLGGDIWIRVEAGEHYLLFEKNPWETRCWIEPLLILESEW